MLVLFQEHHLMILISFGLIWNICLRQCPLTYVQKMGAQRNNSCKHCDFWIGMGRRLQLRY